MHSIFYLCKLVDTPLSYSTALRCPTSAKEEKTIRLNRALAYLKTNYLEAALIDTECLSSPLEASEKALYRAAQALYKLERFQECQDLLTTLCKKYSKNSSAEAELRRARCRLEEQERGIYDFKITSKEISEIRPPHLDHATFVGPVIIRGSAGRGRGLFTTKAVRAGELILCEKAFAHCFANTAEPDISSKITLLVNADTKRMVMGTQGDLITTIVQKLRRNPSLQAEFTSLHHGSYQTVNVSDVDDTPIIDT
jgi:hypothetical protein